MARKNRISREHYIFAVTFIFILLAGIVIGRYELLPITSAVGFVKSVKRNISIIVFGEGVFVEKALKKNYIKTDIKPSTEFRSIDTSRLPLFSKVIPLSNTGEFASSDEIVGGSLASIDGSLFLMDRLGNIFNYTNGAIKKMNYGVFPNNISRAIIDLPEPLLLNSARALYISYDNARHTIYASLQRYDSTSRHFRFNVSAITINPETYEKTSDWRTIFESSDIPDDLAFRGAAGGRLVVDGNFVYFSVGDYDYGQVPKGGFEFTSQDINSSFGKVFKYDVVNNKIVTVSVGHRNPQGLVITSDGRIVETEHGPEGGDELNLVRYGGNYGWPYKTYGTDYGTFNWPVKNSDGGSVFSEPLYSWVPSIAASPIIQISNFDSRWNGDLLVGSLKTQSIFRLKLIEDRIVFSEPIWIGHRVRDMVQLENEIVLMTDDPALVFVSVDRDRLKVNSKMQKNVEFIPALSRCLSCHHFVDTNPSHLAPTLANIVGKKIASDNFEKYSESLRRRNGIWDKKLLTEFITDPNKFAPGSGMPNLGMSEKEINEVVTALGSR